MLSSIRKLFFSSLCINIITQKKCSQQHLAILLQCLLFSQLYLALNMQIRMHSVLCWSLSNQSSCEKSKTYYEDKIDVLSVKPQVSWKHNNCVIYIGRGGKIKKYYFIASFYELLPSTRYTNRSTSDTDCHLNCMASPVQGINELEVVWGLCQLV